MKIDQQTIDSIRDFIDLGNSYSGTEEQLKDWTADVLSDNGFSYPYAEDLDVVDYFDDDITDHMSLERFVYELYEKIAEGFINVLETEE